MKTILFMDLYHDGKATKGYQNVNVCVIDNIT